MVQHHLSLTQYRMVVWTIPIIQRLHLNVSQHRHNIHLLYMIPRLTTGHHQFDCPFSFSEVFASSWFCYTSPFCHYSEHITNWTFLYTNWGKKLQFYIKEYDFGVHGIHFVRTNDFTTCNLHYADKYLNDLQIAIHVCKLIQPCIFIKWVILLPKKCKQ